MHNTIEALGFTALAAILSQVRPSILRKGQFKWCIRVYKYETYSKHTLSTYSTTIMLSMKFIIISICFTLLSFLNSIKCLTLNIPENKQAHDQVETSSHGAPTVVTSRMLPTTGPKSPRVINTFHQVKSQGDQKLHSSAYTPILGNGRSDHIYPKISVQSGRKPTNVIAMFHAEKEVGLKPNSYLPYQSKESKKDIQNPASLYRLSAAKTKPNDHDSTAVQNHFINMARENKRPKAFSHIKSPADKNAFNKKSIIRMDPGTLNGNLVILVYAPKKPSHEKKWLQLGLPHNENSLSVHHPSGLHQHSSPTQQSSSSEKSPSRKSTLNLINQMDKQSTRPAKKSRNA